MRKTLEEKQVGTRLNTLIAQDNRAEIGRALASAEQTMVTIAQEKQALDAEREGFVRGWRADVAQKLSTANEKLGNAREQLNKAQLPAELVEFRAETHCGRSRSPGSPSAPCCNRASNSLRLRRAVRRLKSKP